MAHAGLKLVCDSLILAQGVLKVSLPLQMSKLESFGSCTCIVCISHFNLQYLRLSEGMCEPDLPDAKQVNSFFTSSFFCVVIVVYFYFYLAINIYKKTAYTQSK